jgi:hypothetical protein
MDRISCSARTYRRLGWAALCHAAAAFGLGSWALGILYQDHVWAEPLWVGIVTLWFFWPIVLALHAGRSWRRFALFVFVGLLVLIPSLRIYNRAAPYAFGLPWIVSMDPRSILKYYRAYIDGKSQARKDIAAGLLVIEESGFMAGGGPDVDILRERYHVEVRALAQCIVSESIIGHEDGYNSIAGPEIDRRIGRDKIDAAREEGRQIALAQHAAAVQREKDLAKKITSLPADSPLTLKSISPSSEQHPTLSPDMERELGNFVQAVEQFVSPLVPKDAPAFELHIWATLSRTGPPKFETSGSGSIPRSIYDPIYQRISHLPVAQWTQDDLSVSLDFASRESH